MKTEWTIDSSDQKSNGRHTKNGADGDLCFFFSLSLALAVVRRLLLLCRQNVCHKYHYLVLFERIRLLLANWCERNEKLVWKVSMKILHWFFQLRMRLSITLQIYYFIVRRTASVVCVWNECLNSNLSAIVFEMARATFTSIYFYWISTCWLRLVGDRTIAWQPECVNR